MKKFLFSLMAIILVSVSSFGQSSTYRVEGEDTIVEAFEIKSDDKSSIITEVKITNKKTNVTLPSFIYKLQSNNQTDLKRDLANNPKSVSGLLTIEVDGQIVYKREVNKGVFGEPEIIEFVGTTALGKKYPCTIKGNFQCAVDRVNAMNFVDYAFCLATSAACLAQVHLSCAWDNC